MPLILLCLHVIIVNGCLWGTPYKLATCLSFPSAERKQTLTTATWLCELLHFSHLEVWHFDSAVKFCLRSLGYMIGIHVTIWVIFEAGLNVHGTVEPWSGCLWGTPLFSPVGAHVSRSHPQKNSFEIRALQLQPLAELEPLEHQCFCDIKAVLPEVPSILVRDETDETWTFVAMHLWNKMEVLGLLRPT